MVLILGGSSKYVFKCEVKLKKKLRVDDAVSVIKCSKQINLPISLRTCVLYPELSSNIMIAARRVYSISKAQGEVYRGKLSRKKV